MAIIEETTRTLKTPISIVCEEDPQEKIFEHYIRLWVNNEISYSDLMKNYPMHEASMLKKILNFILEKLE
jgi:hypothetical protein